MASISDSFGSVGFAWQGTWPHGDHDRQPRRLRSSNISRVAPDCSCPKPGEPSSESSECRLLSRKAIRGQTDHHGTRQCFESLDMMPEARLIEISAIKLELDPTGLSTVHLGIGNETRLCPGGATPIHET
ncbi:hypothetical protein ACCO45_002463 [Purpureocillium lilacinum]|uniref:Uncharacterized protein n=1 Tax=Purpureocillium lilacinum TaxID=33203 RepID=A0ACC4EC23_PURLI